MKYSNFTFDELIRTLRDNDNPIVRLLALRTELELEETHADYLAQIQILELERDHMWDKMAQAKEALRGA